MMWALWEQSPLCVDWFHVICLIKVTWEEYFPKGAHILCAAAIASFHTVLSHVAGLTVKQDIDAMQIS
jgi:hypothetical protein